MPVTDWQAAWDTVQFRVIHAFNALREEIEQFRSIDAE